MSSLMAFDEMLPGAQAWGLMKQQAAELLRSNYLPNGIKSVEQVVVIILKGRELGMPPMQALSHINVINGKPTMSAESMLSQIFKRHPKTKISYPTRSSTLCELKAVREGCEPSVFSFSIEDAERAGLLTKDGWRKYPRAMLHARCVSEMARSLFPDALSGCSHTAEELGAEVGEDGEVINVPVIVEGSEKKTDTKEDEKPLAKFEQAHAKNAEKTKADDEVQKRREKFCAWAKGYCAAHGLLYTGQALARIYDHINAPEMSGKDLGAAFEAFVASPDESVFKGMN